MTQADLADRLGVTHPYIVRVEGGRENPTVGQLFHIASALGAGVRLALPLLESSVELP